MQRLGLTPEKHCEHSNYSLLMVAACSYFFNLECIWVIKETSAILAYPWFLQWFLEQWWGFFKPHSSQLKDKQADKVGRRIFHLPGLILKKCSDWMLRSLWVHYICSNIERSAGIGTFHPPIVIDASQITMFMNVRYENKNCPKYLTLLLIFHLNAFTAICWHL